MLSRQLVDAQCDFSKGTFTDKFHEFVEVKCGGWDFLILLNECLVILDQFFSILHNLCVKINRSR